MAPIETKHAIRLGALVPAYNEAARLPVVLNILLSLDGFSEILCVDDGSMDGTAAMLRRDFPRVQVLALPANRGKAGAVLAGAQHSTCDHLLLMDADLQQLDRKQLAAGLAQVSRTPDVDMVVFVRTAEPLWARLIRGNDLFSGERIIRRADLVALLQGDRVHGYELEVALNQYMIDNKKKVLRMPLYCRSKPAAEKIGFWAGWRKELRMAGAIFKFLGVRRFVQQMLWFAPFLKSPV
jgi:glycosyltransferase involved in cell wall biosynthesis